MAINSRDMRSIREANSLIERRSELIFLVNSSVGVKRKLTDPQRLVMLGRKMRLIHAIAVGRFDNRDLPNGWYD